MIRRVFLSPGSALTAALWYVAATVVLTWPVAAGLARDVPGDLGDPLLNCWILGWGADHLTRLFSGYPDAMRGFWNANIFYPEPLALAYSEHLFALVVQILPVYAATGNLILCYNLLLLSSFVLSGLGAYLLVRDLTGNPMAALAAGMFYAFAPYRFGQFAHLQVLSSQWMPFVLFGLHRYFTRRRPAALIGAAAALVAQNLSCGYYVIFFAPFVALFVLFEIHRGDRWRDIRVWRDLLIAGAVVIACTWPFITPYLEVRNRGFAPRPVEEVQMFSADVYSYLTAHPSLRLLGGLRAHAKAEGDLFPTFTLALLAAAGCLWQSVRLWKRTAAEPIGSWPLAVRLATLVLAVNLALVVMILLTGGQSMSVGPLVLGARNVWRPVRMALVAAAAVVALSPRARRIARTAMHSPSVFCGAALLAAFWLSLGPQAHTRGRPIVGSGAYYYLYTFVPGFDGLRVPARHAMIGALFLAILAGLVLAQIERRRRGRLVTVVATMLFVTEVFAAPVATNVTFAYQNLAKLPARVYSGGRAPAVYRALRQLPTQAVVVEFPFGVDGYELRYVFYSTVHWRRLVNGYSGGFPQVYLRNRGALLHVRSDPDAAWATLAESGATHAVVHTNAYPRRERRKIGRWLRDHGAHLRRRAGRDLVYELPGTVAVRAGH